MAESSRSNRPRATVPPGIKNILIGGSKKLPSSPRDRAVDSGSGGGGTRLNADELEEKMARMRIQNQSAISRHAAAEQDKAAFEQDMRRQQLEHHQEEDRRADAQSKLEAEREANRTRKLASISQRDWDSAKSRSGVPLPPTPAKGSSRVGGGKASGGGAKAKSNDGEGTRHGAKGRRQRPLFVLDDAPKSGSAIEGVQGRSPGVEGKDESEEDISQISIWDPRYKQRVAAIAARKAASTSPSSSLLPILAADKLPSAASVVAPPSSASPPQSLRMRLDRASLDKEFGDLSALVGGGAGSNDLDWADL